MHLCDITLDRLSICGLECVLLQLLLLSYHQYSVLYYACWLWQFTFALATLAKPARPTQPSHPSKGRCNEQGSKAMVTATYREEMEK